MADAASVCDSLLGGDEDSDEERVAQKAEPQPKRPRLLDCGANTTEQRGGGDDSPRRRSFSGAASVILSDAVTSAKRGRRPSKTTKFCKCCKCWETDQDPVSLALLVPSEPLANPNEDPCALL